MPPRSRSAAAKRLSGAAAAAARAAAMSSTSRSAGSSTVRSPSARSRARWWAPVSALLIGTPANAAGSGARSPIAPVAAVVGRPERRVGVAQRAQAAVQERRA